MPVMVCRQIIWQHIGAGNDHRGQIIRRESAAVTITA
jgi:hypothetical protein